MPFTLDSKNYSIKMRKGDSGSIIFKFNIPLNDFCIDFCVSKDFDNKIIPVISKAYKGIEGDTLEVNITSEDTEKIDIGEDFAGQYYWSLKIHNDQGFASTLIPNKFRKTPRFFIYPKLGDCPNE